MMRLSCALLAALLLLPPVASAQDPDLAAVEQLYREGRDLFETADYDGAIAKWTEAYSMLGDSAGSGDIKSGLLYNLATAHEAAFGIDGDITHLTKAKVLIERFGTDIESLYEGTAVTTEQIRVVERLAAIDAKIAAARPDPPVEPAEPEVEPIVQPEPEPEPLADEPRRRSTVGRPLIISGGVVLGLGIVALDLGIAAVIQSSVDNQFASDKLDVTDESLDSRHAQIRRGELMNDLSYAGLVVGGVLTVAGAAMLGVGLAKRSKARRLAASPSVTPGSVGLILRGAF